MVHFPAFKMNLFSDKCAGLNENGETLIIDISQLIIKVLVEGTDIKFDIGTLSLYFPLILMSTSI